MSTLLPQIHTALQYFTLRYTDGQFVSVAPIPRWANFFLAGTHESEYDLLVIFPYLTCFIDDALACWSEGNNEPIYSGVWLETDELGNELALEAQALTVEGQPILLIQPLGKRYYEEMAKMQQFRDGLLNQEMLEREVRLRTLAIRHREEATAIKLVSLTSYRDEETGAHVRRIGLYAAAMAKTLNWPVTLVDNIRIAAPMHDIGKIGIPDRILLKAGKLTDAEFSIMKRHPEIGAKMLEGSGIPALDMAAEIAVGHHEKWDGSGYPYGLVGEDIPIAARITSIVDVYDALVHERVYKKALAEEDAIELMRQQRGKHFDPELLDLFMSLLPTMRRIRSQVQDIGDLIAR